MTEQEAKAIMKACGWTFLRRVRKGHDYVYAERKVGGKVEERYIGSLASLAQLTDQNLRRKLSCA